jgi:cation-transporting ATPase E
MHFVLPASILQCIIGLGVYLAYMIPAYQNLITNNSAIKSFPAFDQSLLIGQTALAVFSIFCGLLLLVFVEPPTPWWAGGDSLSGDRRPAILALGLLAAFIVFLLLPRAGGFFDFSRLKYYDYFIIGAVSIVWGIILRKVWRSRLLDRFLEVDLSDK